MWLQRRCVNGVVAELRMRHCLVANTAAISWFVQLYVFGGKWTEYNGDHHSAIDPENGQVFDDFYYVVRPHATSRHEMLAHPCCHCRRGGFNSERCVM